jgi:hypothetical protein
MASSGDIQYPAVNGPAAIADNVAAEASKTSAEFRALKDAKVTPSSRTTTGQQLTHYHSLVYSLLSWERPRATAVSFASVIFFILAARFLPLLRWFFKFLYISLGVTATAEGAGKLILNKGLTSSFRPRKYYTLPKETVEGILEDLEQLADFFLIEFQRILFAENVFYTSAVSMHENRIMETTTQADHFIAGFLRCIPFLLADQVCPRLGPRLTRYNRCIPWSSDLYQQS